MKVLTTSQIAKLLGITEWRVRRLFEMGILPEPARIGASRAVPKRMLPRIIEALKDRGWLPAESSGKAA